MLTIKGVVALPWLFSSCTVLYFFLNSLSLRVMINMEGPLTIELVQDFRLKGEFTSE
jgi:hypothetical protein